MALATARIQRLPNESRTSWNICLTCCNRNNESDGEEFAVYPPMAASVASSQVCEDAKKQYLPASKLPSALYQSYDSDDDTSAYGTSSYFGDMLPKKHNLHSNNTFRSNPDLETVYNEADLKDAFTHEPSRNTIPITLDDMKNFGQAFIKIKYDAAKANLKVEVLSVSDVPGKEKNGPSAYQVSLCMLPKKRKEQRWHSTMVPGPDPKFEGKNKVFTIEITPDEILKNALRIRLYACERRRRHKLLSETTLAITSLDLKVSKVYDVKLESRKLSKGLRNQLSAKGSSSEDDLHSSISRASSQVNVHLPAGETPASLVRAKKLVAEGKVNWPELMMAASYNALAGRLEIELGEASRLKIPGTNKAPNAYVKIILKAKNEQELAKCKSHTKKDTSNPRFNEKFILPLGVHQLKDVTLMVYMCHKKAIGGKEAIGWFAMGATNTGSEEKDHWDEIMAARGESIIRWHVLHEKNSK
ncbi:synaptotagmin XVI [Cichlidogyrus casuarinus]|uniref:Synaptotagmin XVI n=1 Tax=Cichlidogyrus casuarinus TaxID=1844966 RepID=A0ABD2QII5_9PLAT